jgi:hypothetical protein
MIQKLRGGFGIWIVRDYFLSFYFLGIGSYYIDLQIAPIIDHLNLSATPQLVRGEIENNGDVFHQAPSPQVDEAWDNLLKYNNVWVTSKELRSAGKDPEISVKLPLDYGFGPDAYAALTDIGHKFHCLDWIRKDVYVNYYAPNGSTSITDLHKAHTNHCIYILYQSIKCEASTDIMGSAWYEGRERPETEFNFKRKCGDMNGVSQWAKGRSIDGRMINKIKKPKGQRSIAISDELLRILFLQDKNT